MPGTLLEDARRRGFPRDGAPPPTAGPAGREPPHGYQARARLSTAPRPFRRG